MSAVTNNRQIAKNAGALYLRMFVSMLIGLYTSRIILNALGVVDYGIYNVVGGFVSMFSLISGSLQSSVGRFINFELGTGNKEKLKQVFSTSFFVMVGLAILIVIATEGVGIWYVYNKMVIPAERFDAALWCFHISVISFALGLITTPYGSALVSHEKMTIYAYFSILDVVFKLLICYLIQISPIDRLVFYALLLFGIQIINQIIYWAYCKKHFEECALHPIFIKSLFKEMFGFAGWNFIGSSAGILRSQGASLLLNAFGGPILNAANGITTSITGIVSQFVGNFTQAFSPQITKRYAAKEYESLMTLLIYGSKYSYYLMFILALPVMLNAHFILMIWLGQVPEYTVEFIRWTLVFMLAESISRPIITAKNATGKIRNYQIVVGGVLLLMLPLSYISLKLGMTPVMVPFFNAFTAILAIFARMYMLRGDFPQWSSRVYFYKVFLNVIYVSAIASILPLISYFMLPYGWMNLVVTTIISLISGCITIYYLGCQRNERELIKAKIAEIKIIIKAKLRK